MLQKFLSLLKGSQSTNPEPLRGRPPIRREKLYSADSGYVYQYIFEGYRSSSREEVEGHDYIFNCSSDRIENFLLTIFAPRQSFFCWEQEAGRELTEVEHYAVIKMRLFEIFDEHPHIKENMDEQLTTEQVSRHIETLDL